MKEPPNYIQETTQLLRRLAQANERYTKQLNMTFGISLPQLACILFLHKGGPSSPSKLAEQIMVDSSTLTGIIDRMERKGLVIRTPNPMDRRSITIAPTDSGRALAQDAPPLIQKGIVEGLQKLRARERDRIIKGLRQLAEMLDA